LLKTFFQDWIYYSPVPDVGDAIVLPSKANPTGIPNGPGYYIEKWDWLANTPTGLALNGFDNEFRKWFINFLNTHGKYIKSPASNVSVPKWLTYRGTTQHPFSIKEYVKPKNGFSSFNDFFLRYVKHGRREVSPTDRSNNFSVVSPSDGGIFNLSTSASSTEHYVLPSKRNDKFNLDEAFPGYGSHFEGGPLLDTLLWFTDFHHFFAPVSGRIIAMNEYPGSYNYDFENFDPYHPEKKKPSEDSDKVGWYASLSTHKRYVWIIQTESMGLVGMAAIGFWGVGSIVVDDKDKSTWPKNVVPVQVGDDVEKGQYLGHFGYGGSSIVLAFQPSVKGESLSYDLRVEDDDGGSKDISCADNPTQVKAMQHIATASIV